MPIVIKSHRATIAGLMKAYPDAIIYDVTSRGVEPWVCFSPFYPHGGIPVPFSPGMFATTVEGIWQGLKVFETTDVDASKLLITDMKGIKRPVRKYGKVLGHRMGLYGDRLLSYGEARRQIYLPSYKWVLDNCIKDTLDELWDLTGTQRTIVLLDYETNCDVDNLSRPLSHAGLIKLFLDGNWPTLNNRTADGESLNA